VADNQDRAQRIERIKRIERIRALEEQAQSQPEEPTTTQNVLDVGKKGLMLGLRGLDYAGGIARTAYAGVPNAVNILAGNPSVVNPEDLLAALKGRAPTTADYLERAQVPEMGSVDVPFTNAKITGRDVLGFAGDVATDPLTYVGAPGGSKALRAASLEPAIEGAGRKIFKGGFGSIDRELAEKGVAPISETLFKEGFVGTSEGARKATNALRETAGQDINKAVAAAGDIRVKPDFSEALSTINNMRKDPGLKNEADSLEKFVKMYDEKNHLPPNAYEILNQLKESPLLQNEAKDLETLLISSQKETGYPLAEALQMKRNLRQNLPANVYKPTQYGAQPISQATQVEKQMVSAITDATDKAGGEALKKANKAYGQTKAALPLLQREAKKEARKKGITVVDALLAGGSFGAPQVGIPALALKKAVEAANTTAGRTALGQALRVGQKPLAIGIRRGGKALSDQLEE
jgi:NAD(P)-dependent dehydrogenase (short-subunit alcohol dehydrogenase family)